MTDKPKTPDENRAEQAAAAELERKKTAKERAEQSDFPVDEFNETFFQHQDVVLHIARVLDNVQKTMLSGPPVKKTDLIKKQIKALDQKKQQLDDFQDWALNSGNKSVQEKISQEEDRSEKMRWMGLSGEINSLASQSYQLEQELLRIQAELQQLLPFDREAFIANQVETLLAKMEAEDGGEDVRSQVIVMFLIQRSAEQQADLEELKREVAARERQSTTETTVPANEGTVEPDASRSDQTSMKKPGEKPKEAQPTDSEEDDVAWFERLAEKFNQALGKEKGDVVSAFNRRIRRTYSRFGRMVIGNFIGAYGLTALEKIRLAPEDTGGEFLEQGREFAAIREFLIKANKDTRLVNEGFLLQLGSERTLRNLIDRVQVAFENGEDIDLSDVRMNQLIVFANFLHQVGLIRGELNPVFVMPQEKLKETTRKGIRKIERHNKNVRAMNERVQAMVKLYEKVSKSTQSEKEAEDFNEQQRKAITRYFHTQREFFRRLFENENDEPVEDEYDEPELPDENSFNDDFTTFKRVGNHKGTSTTASSSPTAFVPRPGSGSNDENRDVDLDKIMDQLQKAST